MGQHPGGVQYCGSCHSIHCSGWGTSDNACKRCQCRYCCRLMRVCVWVAAV